MDVWLKCLRTLIRNGMGETLFCLSFLYVSNFEHVVGVLNCWIIFISLRLLCQDSCRRLILCWKEFSAAIFMRVNVVEINSIFSIYEFLKSSVMLCCVDLLWLFIIGILRCGNNGVLQQVLCSSIKTYSTISFNLIHSFV